MNGSILTIIRKELRSYFLSPVALIFLGVFLVATLFIFFTLTKFFARNLADVRPLFNWLPILLVFLVSAITMRQWSEEQKLGTLEVLLTLPLKTTELVLGKFFAGVILVMLALTLTLPLPITVSTLGSLDWGPVIGGYIGALLLASTYMAIGLCVSARTDNQIVALMVTLVIGGLLYLVGSGPVAEFFGNKMGEFLRAIGTGSRFESIERGVLDIRDFVYYGTLTAFFLTLNVYFLELKRMEAQPADGKSRRPILMTTVLLAGLNVAACNIWLAPITTARADLTADQEYTISETTDEILESLTEPLTITGYFSEKTHPLLAPLVPRIRDFLREYEVQGDGNVSISFVNPSTDEELEEEINERYGIASVPFRVSGRNEQAVVNSYFHILIEYGDEHKVLSFADLIEFHADDSDITVRLRNLEYDISRAIRGVSQGFQSLESVLATTDAQIKITGYISAATLPEELKAVPDRLAKAIEEVRTKSGGRVSYAAIDPTKDIKLQEQINREFGFRPLASDLYSNSRFWCYLLVESGDKRYPVFPQGDLSNADVRKTVESAVRRIAPGFMKTVGIVTQLISDNAPNIPGMPKKPDQRDYRSLELALSEEYEARPVKIDDGVVPSDIDVLIVAKPGVLTPKRQYAIDQYLMRGGSVIFLAGTYMVKPERSGLQAVRQDDTLFDLLKSYGVTVEDAFVMDPRNTSFPIPVQQRRGPTVMNRIELLPYPFFANIRPDAFNPEHVAMKGVPGLAATWSSPVKLATDTDESGGAINDDRGLPIIKMPQGLEGEYLAWTSAESWLKYDTRLEPDFQTYPDKGFGAASDATLGSEPVAVSVTGTFTSHFAERPSPLFGVATPDEDVSQANRTGRTLKTSNSEARLVVIGSTEFASDLVTQMGQQIGGGTYRGNILLVKNLVDWSLADTDMLKIRSAGAFARTLRPLKQNERTKYEAINYAIVLIALLGVLVIAITRRRMAIPIPLPQYSPSASTPPESDALTDAASIDESVVVTEVDDSPEGGAS
jgi:ABC-2 type transport system permease protein